MAAIYSVYTSPNHPPIPNHLPTLIVTPHGQPSNILYSYLHTNFNTENYLLTPSPQGDLCVAKLFPPRTKDAKSSSSDPGHTSAASSRVVQCEASRNLKWTIANAGVISPIYKLSLPSPDSPDLPLFQISKPNPNATFWSMFYFAYAGHNIPPKRIEFGKIQKNPPGPNGGGTRISITGKTPEEKAVWQTLGEGNEDCVEWVVLCAALNLLDDEIVKAAEKSSAGAANRPAPVTLRDPGPAPASGPAPNPRPPGPSAQAPPPPQQQPQPVAQRPIPAQVQPAPGPARQLPPGFQPQRGYPPQGNPGQGVPPAGYPSPQGYAPNGMQRPGPPPHMRSAPLAVQMPPFAARPPMQGQPPNMMQPSNMMQSPNMMQPPNMMQSPNMMQPQPGLNQPRRF